MDVDFAHFGNASDGRFRAFTLSTQVQPTETPTPPAVTNAATLTTQKEKKMTTEEAMTTTEPTTTTSEQKSTTATITTITTTTPTTTTTTTPITTPTTITTTNTPSTTTTYVSSTSASGAQSTVTVKPEERIHVEFAFVDDFKKFVGNNTNAFADKHRLQLAQVLEISEDRIRDLVVSPGK